MAMIKKITKDERLVAFALFTMATQHYAKCREFERALAERLGIYKDEGNFGLSNLSDAIYGEPPGNFDGALARDGIEVEGDS